MIDPNAEEPISNLSDSSFVILGQGSLPPQLHDEYNCKPHSDFMNKSAFFISDSNKSTTDDELQNKWLEGNSLSEEEIKKKLDKLMKENFQLKETLSQNNSAIKSQLDTFFMWQQEVLKTHETHKQKFLETKDLILKLRKENTSLKKQLEEFLPAASVVNEEFNNLNSEMLCSELSLKNENLEIENQKLRENLKVAKSEILILSKEVEDLERENTYLKQRNCNINKNSLESLSHKSLPNAEARAQISNLFKQLEDEKDKVLKLKEELKKSKSSNEELSNLKLSTTEELNYYINKISVMNTSLNMQNQRFNSLQSWVSLAEENLKGNKINEGVECNLICEIKELKSHLNQEENVSREKLEYLEELKKQFNRLLEEYKTLQLQLTSLRNNESSVEKYKEDFCILSTQLEAKDKELLVKQQECDNLKETIKKLNLECEEVAALRLQIQLYQNDFNDEQAARVKLAEEKEEMTEQIQFLHRKLEALETDGSNKNNLVSSPLESPGKKSKFTCPKCMFSFSDLSTCEKHIDECLNCDFYP